MLKEKKRIKAITKTVPTKHRMLTIRLLTEDHILFRTLAAENDTTMQDIVSELIVRYLEEQKAHR